MSLVQFQGVWLIQGRPLDTAVTKAKEEFKEAKASGERLYPMLPEQEGDRAELEMREFIAMKKTIEPFLQSQGVTIGEKQGSLRRLKKDNRLLVISDADDIQFRQDCQNVNKLLERSKARELQIQVLDRLYKAKIISLDFLNFVLRSTHKSKFPQWEKAMAAIIEKWTVKAEVVNLDS